MKTKTFRAAMEIKANGQPGEFRAVFSTFNVIDHDGDVTLPGAFKDNAAVRISYWGHRWQDLPVGRGVIHQDEKQAWVDGVFFLETQAGKETYLTVKGLGDLQEWSYGYDILNSELGKQDGQDVRFLKALEVPEVSPVLLGAGIDTRTEEIKGMKAALPTHSTPTTDAAWDGPAMDARCPSERAPLRATHAWVDPEGDPDVKSSYKFIHHMVAADGTPGAANIRACQTGIGVLNGGRGGTTIPDADRQGVWNHLAKHLRDADLEPPELKSVDDHGQTSDGAPRNPPPSVVASLIRISQLED
jgi:HK97 family phage prohead protease